MQQRNFQTWILLKGSLDPGTVTRYEIAHYLDWPGAGARRVAIRGHAREDAGLAAAASCGDTRAVAGHGHCGHGRGLSPLLSHPAHRLAPLGRLILVWQ